MMLLTLSLMACGSDTAQENAAADTDQAAGKDQPASEKSEVSTIEDAQNVPRDYQPAFPKIELKKWYLTEFVYEGRRVKSTQEDKPIIRIANGKISGHGGCNKFSSTITLQDDGTFNMGELASTKMLCQGKMTLESRFFELLKTANSYSVNKVFLEIEGEKGQLSFRTAYTSQPDKAQ